MRISDDVLAVLSTALEFTSDGNAKIVQKLERSLYVKVDKVLQACGGAWNKRAKAHIFTGETPAEVLVEQALATGEVTVVREDLCFFPTPIPIASQLADLCDIRSKHHVLEPSAGTGRLVDAALARKAFVTICERNEAMCRQLAARLPVSVYDGDDFLDVPAQAEFDRVLMNPNFTKVGKGDCLDHVRHAHKFLKPTGKLAAILPVSITFRQDTRYRVFRDFLDRYQGVVRALPEDAFKESGTRVRTVAVLVQAVES